jgi:hypothetical protein
MELNRIEVQYVDIDVTATLRNGTPATLTGVSVALVAPRAQPTGATTWTTATYTNGTATVILAGPDATASGALTVPAGGADLWILVTDNPEIDAAKVGRISVV